MIFVSAGHAPYSVKQDFGAEGCNYKEALLTIEMRDLVTKDLDSLNRKYIKDLDTETLSEYLTRIQTGTGSVVCEFHFDAYNGTASGATALVGDDADRLDKAFAKELVNVTASILGIPNRGVKSEAESHRGRLGLMREQGIVSLLEVCFIDNCNDMQKYQPKKAELAKAYAQIIAKYEDMM